MKVQRYESNEERLLLTALIVHTGFLEKIHRHYGTEGARPFKNKWSNLIARWCFNHYAKYHRAPRRSIQTLFTDYAQSSRDKDAVELVETFLSNLDSDYRRLAKGINEDFLVDKASSFFDKVRLSRMAEAIDTALQKNDVDEARLAQAEYERLDFSSTAWKDPFSHDFIRDTFTKQAQAERIVEFPGDLGKFVSPHLKRGGFVSFAGPDKRGKSFWLQEVVWRALKQRRRVLYYVLGDMSDDEVGQRLSTRLVRRPLQGGLVKIPRKIKTGPEPLVRTDTKKYKPLTSKQVMDAADRFLMVSGSKESRLRLRCDGGSVVSAGEIEQDVKRFAKQDWIPDLVVIDYADLLLSEPETRNLDIRHQINSTWMILRRIALQSHCLVVTATQTAATAYGARLIRKKDFSEDKRKNAHVTGLIGINQTDNEKENGVYRLNWIVLRGGKWSESKEVYTAGDLSIACPCIISSF